jgi:formate hydrogenlyase subunit 6/NADH:ubiquinone oxidoreductase subunit I
MRRNNLPFADINISDSCNICGVCCYICPTGALQKKEEKTKVDIVFDFANCVGCGLCERICDMGSLKIKDKVNLGNLMREPISLHTLPKNTCMKCNMSFVSVSESKLCPQCEKRDGLKRTMERMRD